MRPGPVELEELARPLEALRAAHDEEARQGLLEQLAEVLAERGFSYVVGWQDQQTIRVCVRAGDSSYRTAEAALYACDVIPVRYLVVLSRSWPRPRVRPVSDETRAARVGAVLDGGES